MSRELDCRDQTVCKSTPQREAFLKALASDISDNLIGEHRVRITRFDAITGNPAAVASDHAPNEKDKYIKRALDHVNRISPALGLTETQPTEFTADPHIQRTSSGAAAVHLRQLYKSIPIFQAAETVRFAPDGTIKEATGRTVAVDQELGVDPVISVKDAVNIACEHVAAPHYDEEGETDQFGEPIALAVVDTDGFEPTVITAFSEKPEQTTIFESGPFGDKITASLIWFDLDGHLRLAWEVLVTMPNSCGKYRTMLDAQTGDLLFCRQLMHMIAALGNVFQVDGSQARQMVKFPRKLEDYGVGVPIGLPAGFPDDWVEADSTVGNSVDAHLGQFGAPMVARQQRGTLIFDPAQKDDDDQITLNIFYYNCYMHDFFYLLNFRESDGNFQHDNLERGGSATDRVDARGHPGPVYGTANMSTPSDGFNPVMNMGPVASTGRHTALDSSVVFHEFTHGVTNRLVGGRMDVFALEDPQSSGMGEGWGDYFACTINDKTVVGDWVVNRTGGIRGFPYDTDFPDDFGDLGTDRYTEVHNIGEIWCATLMEVNRTIGKELAVQLVVDALKLSPANPSFLDMRDAILAALDDKLDAGQLEPDQHAAHRDGLWDVFARFGMGPNAASNGAGLSGIVADFTSPHSPGPASKVIAEAKPNLRIPDDQRSGVTDTLTISQSGWIARLEVSVNIRHTFIGDLIVKLASPDGDVFKLHNRVGQSANNLVRIYSTENLDALLAVVGKEVHGDWKLHVSDLAGTDIGRLKSWALDIDFVADA